jgi:hypothetical protein
MQKNDILFSNHNNTSYKVIRVKYHTINSGVFGLEQTFTHYILENLKTHQQTELSEDRIEQLLHTNQIKKVEIK